MKTNSRIKAGKRQGNPGYRTASTFLGGRDFALPKGIKKEVKKTDLTKKLKTR